MNNDIFQWYRVVWVVPWMLLFWAAHSLAMIFLAAAHGWRYAKEWWDLS